VDGNERVGGRALVDPWVGFLPDSGHDHRKALRACRIQQQERKAAVTGDEA
jgi:hypothetical protein